MVEGRRRLGFLHEPAFPLERDLRIRPQHLNGNRPFQMDVKRTVYNAHTAFAQLRFNAVMPECLADGGQGSCLLRHLS